MYSDSSISINSKEQYEELNSSGTSLLIVGLILAVLLAIDLSRIIKLPVLSGTRTLTDSVLAILSLACLFGSHATFKKANILKVTLAAAQKQRDQILNWCTSTYSALQIDKMIEAAETAPITSMEILCLKRLELIQSFLIREYHIDNESYLNDLCEEIYQIIFEH